MKITSLQHPIVKHFISLRKDPHYRTQMQSLVLIGNNLIEEYPFPIKCLISIEPVKLKAKTTYIVTKEMVQKISGLSNYSGMIAEVNLPEEQNIDDKKLVLILDQIQDPGNLGTILRTAAALGWEAVIATPGTVDFFNDKALRSSQGAIFQLPFAYKTTDEISHWIKDKKVHLWVADMNGSEFKNQKFSFPIALVLSNEGNGAAQWSKNVGNCISIPLQNNIESLNVAIAGAIFLYGIHEKLRF